jgi:arylsulfatase A-like enzyme
MLASFNYSDLQRRIAACLISVDDGIGQLMSHLQQTGELDDTVIIYSSDNGFFRGEHGLNDKRAMYEDSIRVPCLVRYPRLTRFPRTTAALGSLSSSGEPGAGRASRRERRRSAPPRRHKVENA